MEDLKFKLGDITDIYNYQEYEKQRENNEIDRQKAETERQSNETVRKENEYNRGVAEESRVSEENKRISAEQERISAETERINAENQRIQNENSREESESTRVTSEEARINAESGRVSAENTRISNENERISNENTRKQAEEERNTAEETRKSNETQRQQYYEEIQTKVNNGDFNGRGIVNTEKVSTEGLVDTYKINYTDGKNPDSFTVVNGGGDMLKSTYDKDNDGVVDNSKSLDGHNAEYFATKEDASYTVNNTSTVNMSLSDKQLTAEVVDGSITEQKIDTNLANKINGKLNSADALFFSAEEEMEETEW